MEAVLLLANSAEEHDGLISALGMGWSQCSTPTPPMSLIMLIKVPWDQTNRPHEMTLELVDGDGHAPKDQEGVEHPLQLSAHFEVGRPAGLPAGTPIDSAQVIGVGSFPLAPGSYQWRLQINGEPVAARSFLARTA